MPPVTSVAKNSFGGILMLGAGTTSLIWAEQYLPSGRAAVIVASIPFFFVILDKRNWKQNFNDKFIISGILIGFAGIIYYQALLVEALPFIPAKKHE